MVYLVVGADSDKDLPFGSDDRYYSLSTWRAESMSYSPRSSACEYLFHEYDSLVDAIHCLDRNILIKNMKYNDPNVLQSYSVAQV